MTEAVLEKNKHFDVVVVGAGFAGLYTLYRMRQLGLTTRVFEAGDNVGGTWYVNKNLGFGLNYSRFDNFGIEEDTYGASAQWFVTDGIGLSLSYAHSEIDDTDVESDSVVLGAELRF